MEKSSTKNMAKTRLAKSQKLAIPLAVKLTAVKETSDTLTRSLKILMKPKPTEKKEEEPPLDPLAEILLRVADMAVMWWVGRRPTSWTLEQHIHSAITGCVTMNDKNLAHAVAKWCDFQRKQRNGQDKKERMDRQRIA